MSQQTALSLSIHVVFSREDLIVIPTFNRTIVVGIPGVSIAYPLLNQNA